MTEFGSIFDYETSTAVFCWIGMAFLTVYAVGAMWSARGESMEMAAQPA